MLKKWDVWVAVVIGLAYMTGSLLPYHFQPDADFLVNTWSIGILSAGLCALLLLKPIRFRLSLSEYTWLIFWLLLIIQPAIHRLDYPDTMIFSITMLGLMVLLSMLVGQIDDKTVFFRSLAVMLIITGSLNVLIQLIQLVSPEGWYFVMPVWNNHTPYGNVAQRNEAAFINTLAVISVIYFWLASSSRKMRILLTFVLLYLMIALGMSVSRIGLLMMPLAILAMGIMLSGSLKRKIIFILAAWAFYAVAYVIGSQLLHLYQYTNMADRGLSTGTIWMRWAQLQQGIVIFLDYPILGAGWRGYNAHAFDYSQNLAWLANSSHSHFFVSQIAAELGIVGILAMIPAFLVFIRTARRNVSYEQMAAWALVFVSILYSCTEYPLWHPRYLIVFVALLALLNLYIAKDSKKSVSTTATRILVAVVCLGVALASVYYNKQYKQVSSFYTLIQKYEEEHPEINTQRQEERQSLYQYVPQTFGLSDMSEILLFRVLMPPTRNPELANAIALGGRVLRRNTFSTHFSKQAALLALDHRPQEAARYFYAACAYNRGEHCEHIREELHWWQENFPDLYQNLPDEVLTNPYYNK
ncbi:MAG: O-antigen ligase C-terminal domain-containing protein [Neisseriaceae bacterium]|nr:O-antigen ligase C-terminal domain-containing protein [Neisseriaceae bacterium]